MNHFWHRVTAPVIEALRPRTILQIGGQDNHATLQLIDAANRMGATVHVAALARSPELEAARRHAGDHLVLHHARGADVVPLLAAPDLLLIDDDPNRHHILRLLSAADDQATRLGQPFPVTVLTRTAENGRRSDVLSALEDFLADRPGRFATLTLPMFHGLTLVYPTDGKTEAALQPILSSLALGPLAAALVSDLEAARSALEIELQALSQAATERAMPGFSEADGPSTATLARALLRRIGAALVTRLRSLATTSAP